MKVERWHERKSYAVLNGTTSEFRWRVNSVIKAYGKILVGDAIDGRIGEMSLDIEDEYGNNIIREISCQPLSNLGNNFSIPSMELTVESGVGNSQDADPKISMDISRDGKTWSDKQVREIGKIGEYDKRVQWRRIGKIPRFCTIRFTMSDMVKPVIIKLEANIEAGAQ